MAPPPRALTDIVTLLNARLGTWMATVTDIVSSDYPIERWNGLPVLRMDIRPEYRERVDRILDVFAQENGVLAAIERDAQDAFVWDEGGYHQEDLLGPWGVGHYLCDVRQSAAIVRAIKRHPELSERDRDDLLGEVRYCHPLADFSPEDVIDITAAVKRSRKRG